MERSRWKAAGGRWQVTVFRCQVSGVRWQVAGGRWQVAGGRWPNCLWAYDPNQKKMKIVTKGREGKEGGKRRRGGH